MSASQTCIEAIPPENLPNDELSNFVADGAASDPTVQSNVTDVNLVDTILLETSSLPRFLANQSLCKRVDSEVILAEIAKLELSGHLHSYYQ